MLLAIDVGNTNISCGVVNNDEVVARFRFTTKQARTSDEYSILLLGALGEKNIARESIDGVIISSVVPGINQDLKMATNECFKVEPLMVSAGVKTGVKINTADPKQVGADLIVDCAAAYAKYKRDCLIVDFGTATKFLYVNQSGAFMYCIIAPGLGGCAQALWGNAAKLPEVEIIKPKTILANETVACMQAGITYGYLGLTEGIIRQIKEEIGHQFPIIATGGYGRIAYESSLIDEYDPDLAYQGLNLIYRKNVK